jgi:hypothetical protein
MKLTKKGLRDHQINEYDILCGQGTKSFKNHKGNKLFRQKLELHLDEYRTSDNRKRRTEIIRQIHHDLKCDYGSRFLKKENSMGKWKEIETQKAYDKISHALRHLLNSGNQDDLSDDSTYRPYDVSSTGEEALDHTANLITENEMMVSLRHLAPPLVASSAYNYVPNDYSRFHPYEMTSMEGELKQPRNDHSAYIQNENTSIPIAWTTDPSVLASQMYHQHHPVVSNNIVSSHYDHRSLDNHHTIEKREE